MKPEQKNSKSIASSKTSVFKTSKDEYGAELFEKLTALQKANEEIRKARKAALNLMEDAILSKDALAKSEEQLRILNLSLEQQVAQRTKELKEQSLFISRVTEAVPDIITVMELASQKINFLNKEPFKAQGFDPDAIANVPLLNLREMIYKEDVKNLKDYYDSFSTLTNDEVATTEYRAQNLRGEWLWFRVRGVVFQRDYSGNVTHILNIIQNITEQKNAEEKINDLNKELAIKNRELETANSELRTFSSVAATDYKETLKHLYTSFEFIATNDARNLTNNGRANIRRAQAAIQKLKLLTDDIVAYSEVQTGASEIQTINLPDIFKAALQKLDKKIQETAAVINIPSKTKKIKGYPDLLLLLFYHLIDNAIKFRKPDTAPAIEIEYSDMAGEQIAHADANPAMSYFVVSVMDNGIGIDPSEKEKIFEIFYKAHDQTKYKGSGIGLAICRKIMDIHHGFITADSTPGEATIFKCFFPL
jgi:PAS domain S-box-containing protein